MPHRTPIVDAPIIGTSPPRKEGRAKVLGAGGVLAFDDVSGGFEGCGYGVFGCGGFA